MPDSKIDTVVIGGGAAGFFAAIHAAENDRNVLILEKTHKLLSKVKVSGGGRCNVMHDVDYASQLSAHYPRGGKALKKAFDLFGPKETREWFEGRGVKLKTEEDGRMFPVSDDSQTIIHCLMNEARKKGVAIRLGTEVTAIRPVEDFFELGLKGQQNLKTQKVIVTTGGHNKPEAYRWLADMGIQIANPIPSLFTFNVPDSDLKDLQGLSVKAGMVQVPGSKWKMDGPILITHWGFSAPAVIKLSAWAAIDFFERNYRFPILLNWCGLPEEEARQIMSVYRDVHPKKTVISNPLFDISSRLWERLCLKAEISGQQKYADLPKKAFNKLLEMIIRTPYNVIGKTTFKEEFVTCGGVELSEVDLKSFESKKYPGLYFAGEVLNVDGVTGGFNFQHAWTSGYLAGRASQEIKS